MANIPACTPLTQPGGGLVFLAIAIGAGLAFAVWAWWVFFSNPERRAMARRNRVAAKLRAELIAYGYSQYDAKIRSEEEMRRHARRAEQHHTARRTWE